MQQHNHPLKSVGVFSTAYLAPVEYYQAMQAMDTVLLEQWEHYQKQSYRNRCRILTANGMMDLSIPVEKSSNGKQLTKDVRISAHSDWQVQHWRSLESAYSSSPFFEYYKDDYLPFYTNKWDFLWDFNEALMYKTIELLDMEVKPALTSDYQLFTEGKVDFRTSIHPKNEPLVKITPYYQVFESRFGFVPNLSCIDLLFNMGNESQLIVFKKRNDKNNIQ